MYDKITVYRTPSLSTLASEQYDVQSAWNKAKYTHQFGMCFCFYFCVIGQRLRSAKASQASLKFVVLF